MNTKHPPDLVDDIQDVPPDKRRLYRPIPRSAREMLGAMTPEERGAWLAAHPLDAELMRRAEEKRARKGKA